MSAAGRGPDDRALEALTEHLERAANALEDLETASSNAADTTERTDRETERRSGVGAAGQFLGPLGAAASRTAGVVSSAVLGGHAATVDQAMGAVSRAFLPGSVTEPLDRTASRVSAITGVIAAAGGDPSGVREALVSRISSEEIRRQRELEAVQRSLNNPSRIEEATHGTVIGAAVQTVVGWMDDLGLSGWTR